MVWHRRSGALISAQFTHGAIDMKRFLLSLLAIVALAVAAVLVSPMSPIPGGALTGEVVEEPVNDWSFAANELVGRLETQVPKPRSVAVTCIVANGQLYVGCSSCSGRYWSQQLIAEPKVRYRVLGKIYNVTATRVTDPVEIAQVWRVRAARYVTANPEQIVDGFWFFRLESR